MNLEQGIQSTLSNLSDRNLQIVLDGNSLVETRNNSLIEQYLQQELDSYFSPRVNTYDSDSFGVSGQSIVDMLSDVVAQVDGVLDGAKDSWLFFGEGENGILVDNRTAAQNLTDIQTYYDDRKTAGWDNVVLILFPYAKNEDGEGLYSGSRILYNFVTEGTSSVNWAESRFDDRKAYTEAVQASPETYCDYLIDLTTHPQLGGIQYALRNSTYHSDYLHMEIVGYDLVIEEMKNLIISN